MAMNKNNKTLIFDMDGVILDSEPLHQNAREMMYKKYHIQLDDSFPDPVGKSSSGFWELVKLKYNRNWKSEEMEAEQYSLVGEQVRDHHISATEGLKDVLDWAKERGCKVGLASSSTRMLVECILNLLEIEQYFDVVVCGDEVEQKKPAPDVYQTALKYLKEEPSNAVAVEDSSTGIQAAKSAGLFCYGYRNQSSGEQDLSQADKIINNLGEILENWE